MFSPEENSGIFTFLVGMIILVMTAVGLSLLMDKRFQLSSGAGEIRNQIKADASEVQDLTSQYEKKSSQLVDAGLKNKLAGGSQEKLRGELQSLDKRRLSLKDDKQELEGAVATIEAKFSDYRAAYRRKTWSGAIGEKLGDISIPGGREYRDATITKVTDVGLEIRHEHGFARIQAPDLDRKIQDRFQWNDEERRKRLTEEKELHQGVDDPLTDESGNAGDSSDDGMDSPREPVVRVVKKDRTRVPQDLEKINELRRQVTGWKMKVSKLRNEKSSADSQAGYGNRTSVPGSLETWKARSARLGAELIKARAELDVAKSKLSNLSPRDPLLKVNPATEE